MSEKKNQSFIKINLVILNADDFSFTSIHSINISSLQPQSHT